MVPISVSIKVPITFQICDVRWDLKCNSIIRYYLSEGFNKINNQKEERKVKNKKIEGPGSA